MTGGPAGVAALEAAGVDTVFGVLGLDGLRAALAEGLASDQAPGDIAHPDAVPRPRY